MHSSFIQFHYLDSSLGQMLHIYLESRQFDRLCELLHTFIYLLTMQYFDELEDPMLTKEELQNFGNCSHS